MAVYAQIPLDKFADTFGTEVELSSVSLGAEVNAVSDEFFAEAHHLLKVEPAPSLKGQFGPNGALYSGWETRRHNPAYDWCIIKLGAAGVISGFDIDTSHFNGNEAPAASVQGLLSPDGVAPSAHDPLWTEILPKVALEPSSRHLFKLEEVPKACNYVKLNMYPDGGIARFRVYGLVEPVFLEDESGAIDLAHVLSGGRVVSISDQHFGVGSNLLLPGRGVDMGDGWETKRSRSAGHKDWVIIRLGAAGLLEHAEIDTANFIGNFPDTCELHALQSNDVAPDAEGDDWIEILPRTKLGPNERHFFDLHNVNETPYTHVRLTIYPDGGVKRVRLIGRRASSLDSESLPTATITQPAINGHLPSGPYTNGTHAVSTTTERDCIAIPALPLTTEAFAPFGQVVQAWSDADHAPKGVKVTPANQGSALKFHKLSLLQSSYPPNKMATAGLSVYRCKPLDIELGQEWTVRVLERHPYTNQAFIPMGAPIVLGVDTLEKAGRAYLVVVAQNGADDLPDLHTLKAFVAHAGQGIVYDTGIWHHPMVALETTMDFTCVETQIGNGDVADCEIVELLESTTQSLPRVKVPVF